MRLGRNRSRTARRIRRRNSVHETSAGFDSELMQVTGPEDGSCVCGDWLGAIVSVTSHNEEFPSLDEALRDGVFHENCRHKLVKFDRDSLPAAEILQATFRTELAVSAMRARAEKSHSGLAKKFERMYEEARIADSNEDFELAREKCTATLELVRDKNHFGRKQERIERALKARLRAIEISLRPDGATS